jgi:nucleolar complex protein 2
LTVATGADAIMGGKKQTKRTRKFVSQGGVKARLQRGTITNKGSLKRKNTKKPSLGDDSTNKRTKQELGSSQYLEEKRKNREESDFVSEKNLGDLDVESFFETFGEGDSNHSKSEEENFDDVKENNNDYGVDVSGEDNDMEEQVLSVECQVRKPITEAQKEIEQMEDTSTCSDNDDISQAEWQMKQEMKRLREKDPEFHQFLKENDDSLLDYGEEESDNEERSEEGLQQPMEKGDSSSNVLLTGELLQKLDKSAFDSHGIKPLRKVVNAFKCACRVSNEDGEKSLKGQTYVVDSSEEFDRLMILSLSKCHEEFRYHLLKKDKCEDSEESEFDPHKPISAKSMEKSEKWSNLKPIIYTFFKSTMHMLSEAKEPQLLVFVLKALSNYVPFLTAFPRLAESMLKALTSLWSAPVDASEDYQVVRLHAFLRMRQLALTQPFPFIEDCLKKAYLAYAKRAKFATSSSSLSALPTLTFMGNCVVELYSLDYHSSYQHAFVYIRQLALHLRTAMQKKSIEAVYCWQYLHCLKLWVAVITEACHSSNEDDGDGVLSNSGEDQLLRSLIFPLSQVILGVARLVPSTRYLPLRLHCVRLLQQIAAAAEIFLPTTSILLDVFDLPEWTQSPKKTVNSSNIQPIALTLRLRADNPLRTMEEMENCLSEVFVLLNREIDLYQYSAGFPEFAVRISQRLKKVRNT